MTTAKQNGSPNGENGGTPKDEFDQFDALIRDRDDDFDIDFEPSHPGGDYDPYDDFAGGDFGDRGLIEAVTRIIESVAGLAIDALPAEGRRQLERVLRDLLVALRDVLDRLIERLDARTEDEIEIEEIPVD
jgi:hypothetical protein